MAKTKKAGPRMWLLEQKTKIFEKLAGIK